MEMVGTEGHILQDSTFLPSVLREWAVRVHGGYGHSQTGHREYADSCRKFNMNPYEESIMHYGEISILMKKKIFPT